MHSFFHLARDWDVCAKDRARGEERRDSDVDIAIACDKDVGIKEWQALLDFVEDFRTLRVVEVVRLDEVTEGSEFWQEIQEDGRVMYERD